LLQLLCAYVLIRLIDNPLILGILFSIYKLKSNLFYEVGINALLLVVSIFLGNSLLGTSDIMISKFNMYLLIFIIGISLIENILKKETSKKYF